MQQALEALENSLPFHETVERLEAHNKAITALRAALKKADEDRAWVEERKANWAKDKALAQRNALEEADRIRKAGEDGRCWACGHKAEPEQEQESVLLQCVTCGTVYADGVPPQVPVKEPFGYLWPTGMHPEFRFTQQQRDGVDGMPVYASPAPTAEDIAQDWDLLKATQESLREHMAEIKRLRTALAEAYRCGYEAGVVGERKRIVNLLMIQHEAAKGAHNYWHVAAQLIQADVASDT